MSPKRLAQRRVALFGRGDVEGLGFGHQRAHPIDLRAAGDRAVEPVDHLIEALARHGAGEHGLAARRLLVEPRHVHVAIAREQQRARDRRRGHHQELGAAAAALRLKPEPLMHAEAVLLVDDHEGEVLEGDRLLKQRVGADQDVDAPVAQARKDLLPLLATLAPGEKGDAKTRRRGEALDGLEVLPGEQLGRRHQRRLSAGLDRGRHGEQRDDGLAAADIALQQPDHAVRPGEIGVDLGKRARLRARQLEGERGDDRLAEPAGRGEDAPARPPHALADDGERKLVGEELIIGEARPCRRGQLEIGQRLGSMHAVKGIGEGRPCVLLAPRRIVPFGELRQARKRLGHRLAQGRVGEAGGEAVDRLEQRQRLTRARLPGAGPPSTAPRGRDGASAASRHRPRPCPRSGGGSRPATGGGDRPGRR